MAQTQWHLKSAIGSLYLVASDKGLQGVFWKEQCVPMASTLEDHSASIQILAQAVRELTEYFEGKRKSFDLPLDALGTPFQQRVWEELKKIPYGKTLSYMEIAKKIESQGAVRAVGSANGRNPLCIVVPCHRVIAANGQLGGYSGGLNVKERLLLFEKSNPSFDL